MFQHSCSSLSGGLPPKIICPIVKERCSDFQFSLCSVGTSYIIAQIAFVRKWKFYFFCWWTRGDSNPELLRAKETWYQISPPAQWKILGTFNLTTVFNHFTKSPFMVGTARFELANGGLTQSFSAVSALMVDAAGVKPASLHCQWSILSLNYRPNKFTSGSQMLLVVGFISTLYFNRSHSIIGYWIRHVYIHLWRIYPFMASLTVHTWSLVLPCTFPARWKILDTSGFEPVLSPCGGDVQPLHYRPWSTERSMIPQHPRWQRGILPIELSMHFLVEVDRLELSNDGVSDRCVETSFATLQYKWQGIQESNLSLRFWRPRHDHYTNSLAKMR